MRFVSNRVAVGRKYTVNSIVMINTKTFYRMWLFLDPARWFAGIHGWSRGEMVSLPSSPLLMLLSWQWSFPNTSIRGGKRKLYPCSRASAITCTIISKPRKHTCTWECVNGWLDYCKVSQDIYLYLYIRGPVNADITGFLCSRYNNAFYFMEIPSFLAPSCHWQLR